MSNLAFAFPAPTEPDFDAAYERLRFTDLGAGAWIAHQRRWLVAADVLFDELCRGIEWKTQQRLMYDKVVDVPRMLGSLPDPAPRLVMDIAVALSERFGAELDRIQPAYYRHGDDSVAWHGDRLGEHQDWSVVAILSLGGPRRFMVRPKGRGRSRAIDLGSGDLLVLGGTMQATWEHAVPKVPEAAPRIALMFRHSTPWGGLPEPFAGS